MKCSVRYCAKNAIETGIAMLSKSFNGKSSIIVVKNAITRLKTIFSVNAISAINVAKKQAILPAHVLPSKMSLLFPNALPDRLAIPSPKLREKIAIVAIYKGKK